MNDAQPIGWATTMCALVAFAAVNALGWALLVTGVGAATQVTVRADVLAAIASLAGAAVPIACLAMSGHARH